MMAGLPKRLLTIAILLTLILTAGFYGSIIFATTKPVEIEIEKGKYYHQPYLAQKCDSCHIVGTEGEGFQLKEPAEELCFTCHKDKSRELTKYSLHKPFSEGKCLICHEPHKSDNPNLLVEETDKLCSKCHSQTRDKLEFSPHSACSTCHKSHSSDFPTLEVDEPVALCQSCHNEGPAERNHPVGKPFIDERTGTELTCSSTCHDPHRNEYPPMLRQPNLDGLCLTCHQGAGDLW